MPTTLTREQESRADEIASLYGRSQIIGFGPSNEDGERDCLVIGMVGEEQVAWEAVKPDGTAKPVELIRCESCPKMIPPNRAACDGCQEDARREIMRERDAE